MRIDNHNFIQQLHLKNEDALKYVIDEYGGLIKSVIEKNMTCLKEQQGECLNDVLLAIWKNIDSFRPEKNSFKNWVAAIAKYKAIDYIRKYKKELTAISYEAMDTEITYKNNSLEAVENELSEKTQELLLCLKEKDREIFLRLYANEESIETVSRDLKMNKSVIYNRISRAKKRIRRLKGV